MEHFARPPMTAEPSGDALSAGSARHSVFWNRRGGRAGIAAW
ncbi:hypothetical protein RAH42_12095 [Pyramidobacter sp. YE332]|nr:hypothetical protein [Pyramidobacter sp. YE332]WOL39860.1 hypothetical protein RAH42_12095 [Pyramidobacter sp. YE332]